ncbi:NDP-sugar epimerase, includes UDP-GlcNAc-inverting 4,6-dehydratase FlaA1 and capsular polysaccharide biosynthesis protein EpsC [Pedobacter steynii]|uniref:NDP-sugar epimerase, includes UDP-GlcNAc-inverting 4,6-dehydratase FlaA1 and capsular polysaccharide biosynthesis protein EpsC n=1 Tax=Pedobacter steynii TaxID=430522 RepID=A0A1G9RBJ2_9SPHI|nr:nucleoside-diphosphate sugar epimerase/dehydratase [Pedobacter steynii]NQX37809.1 polysaccharide biosynthesis protein [Pedobacter steynii]SDM20598.1 NDP-sugar epimerase, includes UDP-GlcNAc-inverting 4,6-dehydratase FlaA1 and capsular polysaccharide biosynthesis protein EpsC [Pedobacter steynii]
MKKILFCEKVYSRWIILLIDQVIVSVSFVLSLIILEKGNYRDLFDHYELRYLCLYHLISVLVFVMMRIHTGIIRYSSVEDIFRVFKAVLLTSGLFILASYVLLKPYFDFDSQRFLSTLIINFFISASVLIALRISVKQLFHYLKDLQIADKEVLLIYGVDRSSLLIKQGLDAASEKNFKVLGFVDDHADRIHKHLEQKQVYGSWRIPELKKKYGVEKMIVMEDCSDIEGRKVAIEKCMECGIRVISVPASNHWLKGKLKLSQLPDLKIEDLLQREPIHMDGANVLTGLCGKRVLVTGAAGSIGSEIIRQILKCHPEQLILCDQAESPLHEMQLEIEDHFPGNSCKFMIINIQNYGRLKNMFETCRPEIIFHAAALKHVPMMEHNPSEAILTNVLGTKNLADLAVEYHAEKFIMISTDKAVKPTNVMGASKRIAEMYIQSLQNHQVEPLPKTKFITTRFGNVLGSNGSVVPRFRAQIEMGGPVTVTDPEVTRYFMTIPEAVQLVLEASVMGNGGEIYIFDMGEPVKILNLAINMIKLAGFLPYTDIKICFVGLRPGEKLYEELLNKTEKVIPTYHEKIKISAVIDYPYEYITRKINELLALSQLNDNQQTVWKMQEIIPEYVSSNTDYKPADVLKASTENTLLNVRVEPEI